MSKSQLKQDLNVLKFYDNKQNGFFVEIGASDGVDLSNTWYLEKSFNWRGICVEPIPRQFDKLVKNRPNSFCCDLAVYNVSDLTVEFDIANNSDLFSGINTHIDSHKGFVDQSKTVVNVKTISLNDLLEKYDAPTFMEYLSLDTEGSEYEILRTFNFNKYTFGLIDVEHNFTEPRRTDIRNLLLANGYVYIGQNKWDDMYKHSSKA
jgi:FkbM family methyltransferase